MWALVKREGVSAETERTHVEKTSHNLAQLYAERDALNDKAAKTTGGLIAERYGVVPK